VSEKHNLCSLNNMKFSDSGIIIGVRKYSESSLIVKVLSESHGLYSGFVRGGTSSQKNRAIYQNFNLVDFTWSSKVEDNLGFFKIELKKSFLAQIISSPIKLTALGILSVIIEENLQERESGEEIFPRLFDLLQSLNLEDEIFLQKYIKFEIELLKILGYGIDLSSCAATGVVENLHFVSPKSARAVCLSAGEEYRNKLLLLPQFLLSEGDVENSKEDLVNGLKLTGFFIDRFLTKAPRFAALVENFSSRNQLLRMLEDKN
jgi:DNA repair protein RecO (recombination protein O)